MGNDCPECHTPQGDCKMRDVFKEMPRNRDDLDLSHIRKGDYKRKDNPQQLQDSVVQIALPAESRMDPPKKSTSPKKELPMTSSVVEPIRRPLSLERGAQTVQVKKGVKWVGAVVEGQPHEKGKVTWDDNTTLTGQFFLGQLAQGQKVTVQLSNCIYEGEVSAGRANGKGKLTQKDGSSYEGDWRDDQPHGQGKQRMLDGSVYEGAFYRGKKHGKGKLYFEDGMYQGLFADDCFNGEGILVLADGRTVRGNWTEGVLEGQADVEWPGGEKYSGGFVQGVRDGQGIYHFADGREWTGEWKEDLQNGFGCYQASGEVVKGVWVGGVKKDQLRELDPGSQR